MKIKQSNKTVKAVSAYYERQAKKLETNTSDTKEIIDMCLTCDAPDCDGWCEKLKNKPRKKRSKKNGN